MSAPSIRVSLLASSGSELLQTPLRQAFETKGLDAEFRNAGFAQYQRAILDPGSEVYDFEPQIVLLYLDAADLFAGVLENPLAQTPATREQAVADALTAMRGILQTALQRLPQALILLNTVFLGRSALTGLDYNSPYGNSDLVHRYNLALRDVALEHAPSVLVVDVAGLVTEMGHSHWYDPRLWYLARSRWSREAMRVLSRRYAAVVASKYGRSRKCLVLDLDNVLWGGIVGEEGAHGVRLGHEGIGLAFREFQRELLHLQRRGILLAICSKNNLDDAWEVVRGNAAMLLKEEHFAATRINWTDKATNVRELAEELNLGLDALVFIDDSPTEREWVRRNLPQVTVPEWPEDPSEYIDALLEVVEDELATVALTDEDRHRGHQYVQQRVRRQLAADASSVEDFYASLDMEVTLGRADAATISRIAQLTQKTNQFNLTTRRYSEAEITDLSRDAEARVLWLALQDKFGDSGVVGVLIVRRESASTWVIDTLLLSCRVMGRTVERAFVGAGLGALQREGVREVVGVYVPTAKNACVADVYPTLGFQATSSEGKWVLDLASKRVEIPSWFRIVWAGGAANVG